ncbi:transposase [Fervidobacterium islandicum]|uniref:Transposase n=1 Tax=Fervidobacterium islandicum TaxID=2423 RepID=A0AAI8CKN0_FERIS|nr:RNA-guided endonuclease TnpB family protein [Fervidobacterium islandicum]AMW32679.1 transposase [Fervidobacterium islandicum]
MSRYVIRTYKVPVPAELYNMCNELNQTAARIYNKTLSLVRKIKQKKDFWLSENSAQKFILRWASNINIHTHSKQAFVQLYFQALDGYFKAIKSNHDAKPPYKRKKFIPFIWKDSAIKLLADGRLRLSLGRDRKPLEIQTTLPSAAKIRQAKLVYEAGRYYLHLGIEVKIEERKEKDTKLVAVDLGILRPITFFDGKEVVSYHGGALNQVLRYRNKELAKLQSAISKCKKDSRRYRKLLRAKNKLLRKLSNQLNDILHKITSQFVGMCYQKAISTIVIGDVTNIRERVEGNDNAMQKVHQWCFRRITNLIMYKAQVHGIKVEQISESYTSRMCPVCGQQNHSEGRRYKCAKCGFEYHRDGVGAVNIYKRYLGSSQVVAGLAPVKGVRFKPHLCSHGVSTSPWKVALSY